MCRFSVSNAPPPQPASPGLEQLLDDDDFCWFDAIADLPDEQVDNCMPVYQADAAVARSSDSSDNGHSDQKASASAGCSDTSSYDLMELFKQQVEQEPALMMANLQAQYSFASFPANPAVDQSMASGMCADAGMKISPFVAPVGAANAMPAAVMPPVAPVMAMPAAPSSYSPSTMSAGLNMAPAMSAPVSAAPALVKPGGKSKKTQEEQEAAIERIKQKRRESAQRSRARKNEYMRQLEIENQGLKDEIHRLQSVIQALQRQSCMQQQQQVAPQMVI